MPVEIVCCNQQSSIMDSLKSAGTESSRERRRRKQLDTEITQNDVQMSATSPISSPPIPQDPDEPRRRNRRKTKTHSAEALLPSPSPATLDDQIEMTALETPTSVPEGKKRRKKKTEESKHVSEARMDVPSESETVAVTIHRSDPLKLSKGFLFSPAVKICIVNSITGMMISQVLQTKCYDVRRNHSSMATWDETLTFDVDFNKIYDKDVVMFFEIQDIRGNEEKNVAWAFLKTINLYKKPNLGHARIQLYEYVEPRNGVMGSENIPFVYRVWRSSRKLYKGSLYVTTKKVALITPKKYETDREEHSEGQKVKDASHRRVASTGTLNREEEVKIPWRRLFGERMEHPNTVLYRIDTGKQGSSVVCFSNSGFYFAVACVSETCVIKIFDCLSGQKITTLDGHMDIIYELSWSVDERYLMSASADGSCRVWYVHEELINRPKLVRIIPHPAYVYSSQFFPLVYEDDRIIATGGYDKVVRTWSLDETRKEPLSVIETMSAINTLRFFKDGSKMFTGDASGSIKTYICSITYQNQKPRLDFQCVSSISLDASYKSPITVMQLHAEEKRMLVQSRRGTAKLLDMRLMRFVAEYENKKTGQCKSVISPCGNYVYIASSKQSFLNIYTIQGKLLGKYPQLLPDAIISSLSIHPFDHMIAASALGNEMPLLVLTKDDTEPAVVTDEVSSVLPANPLSPLAQEMQQIQDILARSAFELADKKPIFMSPTPEPQMRALTGSILNVTGREVSIN